MRTVLQVAVMIALCSGAACTGKVNPTVSPSGRAAAASGSGAAPPGQVNLDCSGPIDMVSSPTGPQRGILDVVGLDITSTLQVGRTDGIGPHRLFAKTALLIHAGREGDLTVPTSWATRLSIAWGNHAPEWSTDLHIPACPAPPAASGRWLVFPGGFSLDEAACVPLQIRAGKETATVHVSVGARCQG
ncbi:hypothetical protein [Actinoallomurus iriomotensis]|uniref:Lipoprotein n=1 Tax=Actinoallomurus iriomotensis TaxID=478107 RepID=A0A9W6RKA2_9ACTN|nr:hypothetical protein [Actinoallomurus iriomotensis]GLY77069.1 hypothetical protein Airi01_053360 [Actinoallomurus iriomotensis]